MPPPTRPLSTHLKSSSKRRGASPTILRGDRRLTLIPTPVEPCAANFSPNFENHQEGDTPATPLDWLTQAAQPEPAAAGQIRERWPFRTVEGIDCRDRFQRWMEQARPRRTRWNKRGRWFEFNFPWPLVWVTNVASLFLQRRTPETQLRGDEKRPSCG